MSAEHPQDRHAGTGAPDESLLRHRSWLVATTLVVVIVAISLLAGRSRAHGPRPAVSFGAQVRPAAGSGLTYTNGWLAVSGSERVAVYAGREAADRGNGLLLIERSLGAQAGTRRVPIAGVGAVTLLRPAVPPTEAAALHAELRFVTASGASGTLYVATGHATLIP